MMRAGMMLGLLAGCATEPTTTLGLDARPVASRCLGSVEPPAQLSAHPCIDPSTLRPTRELVPYGVNAPLWSDGAEKFRYIALPEESYFVIDERGAWELPPDGVLIKEFERDGQRFETRFVVRDRGGAYRFYTYAFLDGNGEATRVDQGIELTTTSTPWTVPSEEQCQQCHSSANLVLGLQTGQLDRRWRYPSTGRTADQLETLRSIDFVRGLEPAPIEFPAYDDERAPIATRARAYLHVNCSSCHRPRGAAIGNVDFRAHVPLAGMSICDQRPDFGDWTEGGDGVLLAPGAPQRSLLFLRATTTDPLLRMEPVSREQTDPDAEHLLRGWIGALRSCE